MIKNIFLDMDGVLCNFVGKVAKLFDTTEEELYRKWEPGIYDVCIPLGVSVEEMWGKIAKEGWKHWANLPLFSWSKDLWKLCNDFAPTVILTSPSQDPHSLAGKSMWMNEHLGEEGKPFRKFLVGPVKEFCAATGHLLIDDSESNCKKFRENGGQAILFPQIWNDNYNRVHERMDYVENWLIDYVNS